jgi:hypothetical protein
MGFYLRAVLLGTLFLFLSAFFFIPYGNWGREPWKKFAQTCAIQWVLFEEQRRRLGK